MELQQKLIIERASLHHSRSIWEWRNDEVTRSLSRNSEVVTWDEHDVWFRRSIVNPNRFFYVGIPIGDPQQSPIGVVRFDLLDSKKGYWEISINMSPDVRGKGFGRLLLGQGTSVVFPVLLVVLLDLLLGELGDFTGFHALFVLEKAIGAAEEAVEGGNLLQEAKFGVSFLLSLFKPDGANLEAVVEHGLYTTH